MQSLKPWVIQQLVEKHFSQQQCKENIVAQILMEQDNAKNTKKLTIAVENYSHLDSIGCFMQQTGAADLECQCIEKLSHKPQSTIRKSGKIL